MDANRIELLELIAELKLSPEKSRQALGAEIKRLVFDGLFKISDDLCMQMTATTSDIQETFEQWENERDALSQFADENQAMKILTRRMLVTIEQFNRLAQEIETESGLFLTPKVVERLHSVSEQYQKLSNTRTQARAIVGQINL